MDRGQIPSGSQWSGAGSAQTDGRHGLGEHGLGGSGQDASRGPWGADPEAQGTKVLQEKVNYLDAWLSSSPGARDAGLAPRDAGLDPCEKLLDPARTPVLVPVSTAVLLRPDF